MSNIKRHPDCRMRSANGNCSPMGGFCTSNTKELCEAMQSAYWEGHNDFMIEMLNKNIKCEQTDLISRADAVCEVLVNDGIVNIVDRIAALPSAEALQDDWVPFTFRLPTKEEKEMYPDWDEVCTSKIPEDGQEVLISYKGDVFVDVFSNDECIGLESWGAIEESMAWKPLPEPYKEKNK